MFVCVNFSVGVVNLFIFIMIKMVIPVEWTRIKLSECLKIRHGKSQKSVVKENGDFPILASGGEIGRASMYLYDKPSVLIGRKGTINKPVYMNRPFWTVDTLFFSEIFPNINAKYAYYIFLTIDWLAYNEGSTIPSLSASTISSIKILLPPFNEQEEVVEVLETWDRYIEKLSKVIKLKKKVKKWLMQKLLTGKIRLMGFDEKWNLIKLGNICEISRGGSPRPIESFLTQEENGFNWLRIGDIKAGSRFIFSTKEKIMKEGLKKTTLVNPGDFILSNSMSYGRPYIMKISACIHDGWLALKNLKTNIDKNYLYYKLLSQEIQNDFISLSAGSGVQNLKKETVSTLTFEIPCIEEQVAIAQILTASDEEIEALEKKKSLIEKQKKFLLNNMISGKLRLPEFTKVSN